MPLSQGKKVFFVTVLVVVGFSALVLNLFRLRGSLVLAPAQQIKPLLQQAAPDAIAQRDSDTDGLSDSDELLRFGTSPYLKDTDSDGILDPVEIKNRTNPLCPEGTTCPQALTSSIPQPNQAPALPQSIRVPSSSVAGPDPELLVRLLGGQASVLELRAFLKSQGAQEVDLAKLDDAALRTLYKESLGQIAAPPQALP